MEPSLVTQNSTERLSGERQFALTAASRAFCNRGLTISVPWEGDLDDRERELFDAMVAAIDAHNDILSRSHREAETGVAVKPLEWAECGTYEINGLRVPSRHGVAVAFAESAALGTYGVVKGTQDRYEAWRNSSQISGSYLSQAEARSAAQADYEQRIRSALASPQRETEGREITEEDIERACAGLEHGVTQQTQEYQFQRAPDGGWLFRCPEWLNVSAVMRAALQSVQERT
jgi:hypothetical protein